MRRFILFAVPVCTLLASAPLMAQDFGRTWLDRISHEVIEDEAQLNPHPLEWKFMAGELISYDSNVFLVNTGREDDIIFTTFGSVNLKYAEAHFDAEADLLVNYNAYADLDDVNADEERFFGRIRYQGTKVTLSLSEVFRRESSPTDVVFATRVSRFLSNTTPLIIVKVTDVFAVELQSDLQLVNYLRAAYAVADNFNTRTLLTFAYTTGWNNMDLVAQLGYFGITYQDNLAPPDASGFIGRLGVRGELSPKMNVIALIGVAKADTDIYPATGNDSQLTTMDAEVHISYAVTPTSTWWVDYSRRFGFAGDGSSFQVVDSAGILGTMAMRDDITLRTRLQYDRAHSDLGIRRAYYSFSVGGDYKIHPKVLIDATLTYRWGVTPNSGGAGDYGDGIIAIGAAVIF